ncbi:MAG: NHL repeat-containing protein [Calditrichia bacterium]|nr:NHL repeat-containing protein [Calditrichia bacterium]
MWHLEYMNILKNRIFKFLIRLLLIFLIFSSISISLYADDNEDPTTFVFPTYYHTYGIRKAGAFELFLFMGFRVNFSKPEGLACVRLDSWEDPEDPHDDDEVTVYGVNSGENNIIYNKSMLGLDVYGIDEENEQLLKNPHGICANSRGDVYVADTGNHRVVRLFNPGSQLQFVTAIGRQGLDSGQFISPEQVVIDNSGNIYVTDTGNNRVQVFDENNKLRFQFSNEGNLTRPTGIAVTDSIQRHQGRVDNFVIVIDSNDQRINKFSLKGKLEKRLSMSSIGYPNAALEYPCLDYYNQLLITDSYNHCIHKFDHELNYITSFGSKGDDDFQFLVPKGIAIYRRFGQLFIAESTGAQYYWIGTDFSINNIIVLPNFLKFKINITEPSLITADILDNNGNFVARISNRRSFRIAGEHEIIWNRRMSNQNLKFLEKNEYTQSSICKPLKSVPSGEYLIKIVGEATYSSRTYFQKTKEKKFKL